jgi:hypothetical protein
MSAKTSSTTAQTSNFRRENEDIEEKDVNGLPDLHLDQDAFRDDFDLPPDV